jgi:uncharacterized repeat protein (TIGR02543 family)
MEYARNLKKPFFQITACAVTALIFLLALLPAGCQPAVELFPETEKPDLPAGKGRVVLQLGAAGGAASRSVSTDFSGLNRDGWTYSAIIKDGDTIVTESPITITPGKLITVSLDNEEYTIHTTAYDAGGVEVARGVQSFTVTAGQTQNVPIYLTPVQTGEGTFAWEVKAPVGKAGDIFALAITLRPGEGAPVEINLFDGSQSQEGDFIKYTGSRAIAAKNYTIQAVLTDTGGKTWEWGDVTVPIYPGLTTTFTKDLYWGGVKTLAGTIEYGSQVSPVVVAAFSDSALTVPVGQDEVAGDYHYAGGANHFYEWELTVPAGTAAVWFGAKFGGSTAFEPQGYLAAVPEKGLTNIALPMLDTVTFNSNGGTPASMTQTVVRGSLVSEPDPPPEKAGHAFEGWYKEPALTNQWNFPAGIVTSDITLYAKWDINTYTVTFDANIDTPGPGPQSIAHGGLVSRPTDVVKAGHTLEGWYQTPNFSGPEWDFLSGAVTADMTLYAKWSANSYLISYHANGGAGADYQQSAVYGSSVTLLPRGFTRANAYFSGWSLTRNGPKLYTEGQSISQWLTPDNVDLYARWVCFAIFVANGGVPAPSPQEEVIAGNSVSQPPPMTRSGYVFEGWYQTSDFSGPAWNFRNPLTAAIQTFYAKWTPGLSIGFNAPGEENISLTSSGQTISWQADTPIDIIVGGSWTAYEWYVDNARVDGENGGSLRLYAQDLGIQQQHVTVRVRNAGGVWYSKTVEFTVSL